MFQHPDLDRHVSKVYGKYRGTVIDNDDSHHPDNQVNGRLLVTVPTVFYPTAEALTDPARTTASMTSALPRVWADPCFPANTWEMPPIGATVWIEFEAGDPAFPIWAGTWPTLKKGLSPLHPSYRGPLTKVTGTDQHTLVLSDIKTDKRLQYTHVPSNTTVMVDDLGNVIVNAGGAQINLYAVDGSGRNAGDIEISGPSGTAIDLYPDAIEATTQDGSTILLHKDSAQIELSTGQSIVLSNTGDAAEITAGNIILDGDSVQLSSAVLQQTLVTATALQFINTQLLALSVDVTLLKLHTHTCSAPGQQSAPSVTIALMIPPVIVPASAPYLTAQTTGG